MRFTFLSLFAAFPFHPPRSVMEDEREGMWGSGDEGEVSASEGCRAGEFVAIAPDGDEPFWLAILQEDVDPPFLDKMVRIFWIDPDGAPKSNGEGAILHYGQTIPAKFHGDTYHLGSRDKVPLPTLAP